MPITNISSSDFIKETKKWGIGPGSLIRVRMMKKGGDVLCRVAVPNTSEMLQTVISEDQYNSFEWMELQPISIGATWDDGIEEIRQLKRKLEEINANNNTITTNRDNSSISEQPTP